VTSNFANPFGPVQLKDEVDTILEDMFTLLFKNDVIVGELYTKLAVEDQEVEGIKDAARALIKMLKE
jgi:methyl coenzyme M reductase subunit C-like uncharacterized protein (methanogenesis marker protein 7)